MSLLVCLNGYHVKHLGEAMKQSKQHKSIRWELEQLAQKQQNTDKPESKQTKKAHTLGLNWKDVVIFSLVMVFTTFYNVNVQAQNSTQPEAIDFDDISSGMMMQFDQATGEYHSLKLVQSEYDV